MIFEVVQTRKTTLVSVNNLFENKAILEQVNTIILPEIQHGYPLLVLKMLDKPEIKFSLERENVAEYTNTYEVLFFRPIIGEIMYARIEDFDEHGNMVVFYGFEQGYVHSSNYPVDFKYDNQAKALVGADKSAWKVGDIVKLRLIEQRKTMGVRPRLRFTAKGVSLGKV